MRSIVIFLPSVLGLVYVTIINKHILLVYFKIVSRQQIPCNIKQTNKNLKFDIFWSKMNRLYIFGSCVRNERPIGKCSVPCWQCEIKGEAVNISFPPGLLLNLVMLK